MNLANQTPQLISMIYAFADSLVVLKSATPLANKMRLFDYSDDMKYHVGSIPMTVGIANTAGIRNKAIYFWDMIFLP